MRLRGFSGTDPTFLAVSISLALTCAFGPRAWDYRDCSDLSVVHLTAIAVSALLLRPRSRAAWIAGALTALLTWHYFTPDPYRRDNLWLFAIPQWIGRFSPYGPGRLVRLFALLLLYLGPIVAATAAIRPDLRIAPRAARVGPAFVAAFLLWALTWAFLPLRYPLNPYGLRYLQVAAYLLPSVVTPLLVWRFTLVRRPEPQWVSAAVTTPLAALAICALMGRRSLSVVTEHPFDCAFLLAFAIAGPIWAYRDWSAHRRNAGSHGFDVILTSSATLQR